MIGYRIGRDQLYALIEKRVPGWLQRAEERTNQFRAAGKFEEKSSIWSEIKAVLFEVQGNGKCIFCERKLESVEYGLVEQDVEHFRPKSRVSDWKPPAEFDTSRVEIAPAPKEKSGYFLLAYNPLNYAASCKPCNSTLKRDRFPIAGEYDFSGEDPVELRKEKPLLIYPIGTFDDDPEQLIAFHGISPFALRQRGHARNRALVTIAFFGLDDLDGRKHLMRERAMIIVALFPQLLMLDSRASAARKAKAQAVVDASIADSAPHANCARSFRRTFEENQDAAEQFFDAAVEFMLSIS